MSEVHEAEKQRLIRYNSNFTVDQVREAPQDEEETPAHKLIPNTDRVNFGDAVSNLESNLSILKLP